LFNEPITVFIILKFILYILKNPVNPVFYMDVVYVGFARTTPGKEEVVNVWNTFSSKNLPGFLTLSVPCC